ncbi:anthranilate synthase component II [Candidatus Margulisiibacteriota bacterium]
MILVIDNYDSFTYNLVQYLGELGADIKTARNDKITIAQVVDLKPTHIVISPGPGRPVDAKISNDIIKTFYKEIPILGVCLGHQCIGEVFGANITYAPYLMHGKTSNIIHDGKTIFQNIKNPFKATRYHSLVIEHGTISDDFQVSAWTEDDIIMAVRHKKYPLEGIQFHPESILTTEGKNILKNFLEL